MADTETTTEYEVAEETTTDVVETETDNAPAPEPEPAPDGGDTLGDAGKAAIAAEREARKAVEKQLREARAALKSYEDRDKSELELLREKAAAAEKKAAEAELERLRTKVAFEKGVPASKLAGTTEDEMMAAADELIAWRDQTAPPPPPKPIPVQSGLKSGASGVENTNTDPKVRAAEALRRHRAVT